jgi:hypothetical protein
MKIFLSLVVAIASGLILGYIPAKILVPFDLQFLGVLFTWGFGYVGGVIGIKISDWTRINIVGIACALIIGLTAFYNYQLHLYLPIKRNPPEGTPPSIIELKNSPEPQGFFKYAQLTASDEVRVFSRRRREKSYMAKMVVWIIEVGVICVGAIAISQNPLED